METKRSVIPSVADVGVTAPFGWLAAGWRDLWRAPGPCLVYGLGIGLFSFWLVWSVYTTNAAFWALAMICGFVFIAPILAMGPYEAGRRLDLGERPRLGQILFVRSAFRQDLAYLGLALLLIFSFWVGVAQIVYGLSNSLAHRTMADFLHFVLATPDGRIMAVYGSGIGAVIAFFAFGLVAISAPMLLDREGDVFIAVITSFKAVFQNLVPMLVWGALIVALILASAATGFLAFAIVFPWLGLSTWRAYRALITEPPALRLAA